MKHLKSNQSRHDAEDMNRHLDVIGRMEGLSPWQQGQISEYRCPTMTRFPFLVDLIPARRQTGN